MSKLENLEAPPEKDAGLFGTHFDPSIQDLIIIGVPWEPTASYGRGTSLTPQAIIEPSHQLDFYDAYSNSEAVTRVGMAPLSPQWQQWNQHCLNLTPSIIAAGGARADHPDLAEVNAISQQLNRALQETTAHWLDQGKLVGILGGDHASPFGAMMAHDIYEKPWGILHVDAHHDLREAYEGFTYSHASIMYNILRESRHMTRLVSVGIRDYAASERTMALGDPRILTFYDRDLSRQGFAGKSWLAQCQAMVAQLPERVYVSFDIDGLDPRLCPHTGTPVPGGLSYQQAISLLEVLVDQGHTVIGFDLCEVSPGPKPLPGPKPAFFRPPGEWDLNVGARLLYQMCAITLASQSNAH